MAPAVGSGIERECERRIWNGEGDCMRRIWNGDGGEPGRGRLYVAGSRIEGEVESPRDEDWMAPASESKIAFWVLHNADDD
ncbi:unnamed protein product [Linum trigynum]|uniref:Uncharacterized protein n=1 Tax=Linum trigynum TaxID=586398 RepID=A0AAV2EYW2_9ROSI